MSPRIDATIQVRMGSSRLPGKSLADICGRPMLARQVERLQESRLIDRIIIATSDQRGDDPIAELAHELGVACFRGSEGDVLGRVVETLDVFDVDVHVEFQGDNPAPDPLLVDAVIGFFLKHQDEYDYVTNSLKTTFPPGAEVSVYPAEALRQAARLVTDDALREHVGIHIYRRPDRFHIHNIEAPSWLHAPDIHLEVDTAEDLELMRMVFEHFLPARPMFGLQDAVAFIRSHGLRELNRGVERRWKAFREDDG